MRRAAKVDSNHRAIADYARKMGASVQSLAQLGQGVPDLLVAYRGRTAVWEVKDGNQPPSKRRLTPDEEAWFLAWRGMKFIVESMEDAQKALRCMGGVEVLPV